MIEKRRWSDFELKRLDELKAQGVSHKAIARKLGRTVRSIERKVFARSGGVKKEKPDQHEMMVRLPTSIYNLLDRKAFEEGKPKSRLIRNILRSYFDEQQPKKEE